jgi:hypothetical protein
MSHDLYASWATTELTRLIKATPSISLQGTVANLNIFANRESGRKWPIADGRISMDVNPNKFELAIELKRTNEGLHGILTAIGQAQAYLHKGYSGTAIIVPDFYDSFPTPGTYLTNLLNFTRTDFPIGVFSYSLPDTTNASPFFNKITCHRPVGIPLSGRITTGNFLLAQKSSTQWAHLREGSSEPYAFFKYLQTAKQLSSISPTEPTPSLNTNLLSACLRIKPGHDPIKYLSNAPGSDFNDVVWRNFWFNYVVTRGVSDIWNYPVTTYSVNPNQTELYLSDGTKKNFFVGRSDSIKNKIVAKLNSGSITENEAWELFAMNIHDRAHSYREDIDSGLEHLDLTQSDGKPSDLGYRFVDACERTNDCHSGTPLLILGAAILKNGSLAAFLHYIYKVSEEKFKIDPLSFTTANASGHHVFDQAQYLAFLRTELSTTLNVMNTASLRGGTARGEFQGEFAILRKFGFIEKFRIGVGLEINWPLIQEFLDFNI